MKGNLSLSLGEVIQGNQGSLSSAADYCQEVRSLVRPLQLKARKLAERIYHRVGRGAVSLHELRLESPQGVTTENENQGI